jgi:hypothetical protein
MLLRRFYMGKNYTQGVLLVDNAVFYTLERPWLDNQVNVSCIPEGRYPIYVFTHRSGEVIGLRDVSGRTEILIHPGNFVNETNGCILPGISCSRGAVHNSVDAMRKILRNRTKDYIDIVNLVEAS